MTKQDQTYLTLKYGDYHNNPELILDFDKSTLYEIRDEMYSIVGWYSAFGANVRDEIYLMINIGRSRLLIATDTVLERVLERSV